MKRTFKIEAVWDDEAGVWYAKSDITGLHIEAPTLDAFEEAMFALAPELIIANHVSARDVLNRPLSEIVPAIIWNRPAAPVSYNG
ncbi:MAG TPA: DUF1902 domain-containing protein [Hellea balneolensis]|uniref:DUF1902 domain-containing protein n=1 Tax=Hellea balneolensis TaxID=287478 RepID=A0A7V5NXH5_9PROT|nr:DUF1902 domain-containing protein [Hellea balneolensis]